jgi:hypothetical protein
VCETTGVCREVRSNVGDECVRELDCGPGQACVLDAEDFDANGVLAATCQLNRPGSTSGAPCSVDGDCRNELCAIGHCTSLCAQDQDCPLDLACTTIPRPLGEGATAVFSGCMQAGGVLEVEHRPIAPYQELAIPVPSSARSFAVVTSVEAEGILVGADRVLSPTGELLYQKPQFPEEFFGNAIRHTPALGIATLLVPNTPLVSLSVGVYNVTVGAFLPQGGPATDIPKVRVFYKLDDASRLDLHFYFLNLQDHPCGAALDVGRLDATSAQTSASFQDVYLTRLRELIDSAGLTAGDLTYTNLGDRPELDGLALEDLPRLVRLSTSPTGVNVFLVRSIDPEGIQAITSGAPGPPNIAGTQASGIAISMDVLCYRSWDTLARVSAHAIARQMGLFHNREPEGFGDPIPDSDASSDNLLFFGEFGGTTLSSGQRDVLRRYPGLR